MGGGGVDTIGGREGGEGRNKARRVGIKGFEEGKRG